MDSFTFDKEEEMGLQDAVPVVRGRQLQVNNERIHPEAAPDTERGTEGAGGGDRSGGGGNSSVLGASFNFVNSIVGCGIVGIPYAVQQCGFIVGIIMLTYVAILIYHSVLMLIECGLKVNKLDFEELSEHLLGWKGYYATTIFMFLFAYGAQVAYLVVIGDTIPVVAGLFYPSDSSILTDRKAVIGLTATFVILPLCLLRDLSTLAWSSLVSIAADAAFVLIVVAFAPATSRDQHIPHDRVTIVNPALFAGIGTMMVDGG